MIVTVTRGQMRRSKSLEFLLTSFKYGPFPRNQNIQPHGWTTTNVWDAGEREEVLTRSRSRLRV